MMSQILRFFWVKTDLTNSSGGKFKNRTFFLSFLSKSALEYVFVATMAFGIGMGNGYLAHV